MAITISGQNNNDRILASDGVLDSISGFSVVGVMTASTFDVSGNSEVSGKLTASHLDIGSNIKIGNAGIITATTLIGNVTGNINHTSNLLLQISGSEKFRVGTSGQLGIGGANYGSSGQVLTSQGSGSAAAWTTITQGVTSDAQRNTVGGTNAGDSFSGTDATDNTILGYDAGTSLTTGDKNVIIGAFAAKSLTTVGNVVAIGHSAYSSQVSSNCCSVVIGHNALQTYTGSFGQVAIGKGAGQDAGSSGGNNTLIGENAGYGCKGFSNTIVGYHAGSASNTQSGQTIIGHQAHYFGNNKAGNTAVGKEAMMGASGGNGSQTTAIGYEALKVLNNGGNQNTALGYQAGDKVNTGTSNVIIGYSAASTGTNDLTNGSNNIIIGNNAAATSATVSNELTIGDANITRFRIPGIGLDLTSAPPTLANGANNRVITATGANALTGESTLTFDGSTLTTPALTTNGSGGINISASGSDLTMNSAGAIFTGNGGNATNPIVANVSDTNTGFFYPAADTIAVTTGGSERLRIMANGDFGFNDTSPTANASGNDTVLSIKGKGSSYSGKIDFKDSSGNIDNHIASDNAVFMFNCDPNSQNGNTVMMFHVHGGERFRFGRHGQLGIGGANYGSSGQVLTSQGSGSAVQWASVSAFNGALDGMIFGGTETTYTSGGTTYKVHTFLSTGFLRVTATTTMDILVVAGGGGSPQAEGYHGSSGGGGAGGMVEGSSISVSAGKHTMTVGAGGAASDKYTVGGTGGDSTFAINGGSTITAKGGGGGADYASTGGTGGNGGGGAEPNTAAGSANQSSQNSGISGISQFGNAGGQGGAYTGSGTGSGGGGGAGGAGQSAASGRAGGSGRANSITGSSVTYAAGGAGGSSGVHNGTAGTDGRGNGASGASASGGEGSGADGGSGIIIVRYVLT